MNVAYIFKTIRQRFVDLHQDLPARIIIMGRELSPDMEYLVSEPLTGLTEAGGSGRNAGSYAHTVSGSDGNYDLIVIGSSLRAVSARAFCREPSRTVAP